MCHTQNDEGGVPKVEVPFSWDLTFLLTLHNDPEQLDKVTKTVSTSCSFSSLGGASTNKHTT